MDELITRPLLDAVKSDAEEMKQIEDVLGLLIAHRICDYDCIVYFRDSEFIVKLSVLDYVAEANKNTK